MGLIQDRFRELDSRRIRKLERSRYAATLTIPSVLPPSGWTNEEQLPQPNSSIPARGVVGMSSRMLSAMLPVNDTPFFRFVNKSNKDLPTELQNYLETLTRQVYKKLSQYNLREAVFMALQHLIIVGDSLLVMEDDFTFRVIRFDHFVLRRDTEGNVKEIIYLDFIPSRNDEEIEDNFRAQYSADYASQGYTVVYNRLTKEEGEKEWTVTKEEDDVVTDEGTYKVLPFIPLRWSTIAGENYGRSHCEDIIGDIATLDAYTESSIEGMAAASAFWMGVDPAGITEIDDLAGQGNGSWVPARQADVFTLSPAQTMNPQIQASFQAVEAMRREVGQAFLLDSAAIPSGDRVTATAVRKIGQELEMVLGGAFSAISREMFMPIIRRAIYLMVDNEEIDERLLDQFFAEDGSLDFEIITGLQALSRDSDLMKLMQMGEMMRGLPPQAAEKFNYVEYARALVTSLGFDSQQWVKTDEEIRQEEQQRMERQMALQSQAESQQAITQGMQAAAMQDIQQTGGQNVQQVMQNMQGGPGG